MSQYIDLNYINADSLTHLMSDSYKSAGALLSALIEEIESQTIESRANAQGYVHKYDNPMDRFETNVGPLKEALSQYDKNLQLLRELSKTLTNE